MSYIEKKTITFDRGYFTKREKKLINRWLKKNNYAKSVTLTEANNFCTNDYYFFKTTNYSIEGSNSTLTPSKLDELREFLEENKIGCSLDGLWHTGYSLTANSDVYNYYGYNSKTKGNKMKEGEHK